MDNAKEDFSTIDEYIELFPANVQEKLQLLRKVIREAAPDAVEKISCRKPTFYLHGNLVHYAAYERHIGFYPTPSGIEKFKKELSVYKGGKGSFQFPLDQPVPFDLVRDIVHSRAAENLKKAATKKK